MIRRKLPPPLRTFSLSYRLKILLLMIKDQETSWWSSQYCIVQKLRNTLAEPKHKNFNELPQTHEGSSYTETVEMGKWFPTSGLYSLSHYKWNPMACETHLLWEGHYICPIQEIPACGSEIHHLEFSDALKRRGKHLNKKYMHKKNTWASKFERLPKGPKPNLGLWLRNE